MKARPTSEIDTSGIGPSAWDLLNCGCLGIQSRIVQV